MSLLAFPNPNELVLSLRASALVFEDAKSKALLQRIERVAPSEINVLIIGETGTGKELVARHVHALSARKEGTFLAVNCGALPETLVESELFGHEKGSFTGALATKQGWFEAASGGTLFLDEIGDLPLSMQVKLLRVLQEREVVRVGSHKPIPIDVRLIAATHVRLEEAVLAGRFREDLYYRLNVAALNLPSLRERPGDILPLAHHFLNFYGQRLACPDTRLSESAQQALLTHSWPGNIRELENVIHHALLVARNGIVSPADLNLSCLPLRALTGAVGSDFDALDKVLESLCDLDDHGNLYARIEQAVLRVAYRKSNNNQLATARLLGLSRHVVRARLIQHDILIPDDKEPLRRSGPVHRTVHSAPPENPAAHDARDKINPDGFGDWWGF